MDLEKITVGNTVKSLIGWAEHFNVEPDILNKRLNQWPFTRNLGPIEGERSGVRQYTCLGRTLSIKEWSRYSGIAYSTLQQRLHRGWDIERAVSKKTPVSTRTKEQKLASGLKTYKKLQKKQRKTDWEKLK